jgi:hypothetical protein
MADNMFTRSERATMAEAYRECKDLAARWGSHRDDLAAAVRDIRRDGRNKAEAEAMVSRAFCRGYQNEIESLADLAGLCRGYAIAAIAGAGVRQSIENISINRMAAVAEAEAGTMAEACKLADQALRAGLDRHHQATMASLRAS